MNRAFSTAVALMCGAMIIGCAGGQNWSSAQQLSSGSGPLLAADPAGNIVAVWSKDGANATRRQILASRFEAGVGWGPAELIDSGVGYGDAAQVGIDAAGNAIALWLGRNLNDPVTLWSNRFVPGAGWRGATAIYVPNAQEFLTRYDFEVAVDGSAVAIIMIAEEQQTGPPVESVRVLDFMPASGWGGATRLDLPADGTTAPALAIDHNGRTFAVARGKDGAVWASQRDPGSDWSPASPIGGMGFEAEALRIAVDNEGNATAVWSSVDAGVWANQFVSGSDWGTATQIGSGAVVQGVAADDTGRVFAVWTERDGLNYTDVFTPAEGWSAPQRVSARDAFATTAMLAVAPDGHATVVWAEFLRRRDDVGGKLWSRLVSSQFDPDAGWSAADALATDSVSGFALTTDSNGTFTAAWADAIDGHIWVRTSD